MWVSLILAFSQSSLAVPSLLDIPWRGLTIYHLQVTFLAILAAKSIAVPLSPAFPAPEVQYILNHSEASVLLSSAKFSSKAEEVLRTELDVQPAYLRLNKFEGHGAHEKVTLDKSDPGAAGMMLYTSGTTNRPVCADPFTRNTGTIN